MKLLMNTVLGLWKAFESHKKADFQKNLQLRTVFCLIVELSEFEEVKDLFTKRSSPKL